MTTPTPPSALDAAEARLRELLSERNEHPRAANYVLRACRDALAVIDSLRAQLAEARAERDRLAALAAKHTKCLDLSRPPVCGLCGGTFHENPYDPATFVHSCGSKATP